jgi:hypothetical protein
MDKLATHDQAPQPKGKAVNFDKIDTFEEAIDYALAAFHVSVDKAHKEKGDKQGQWNKAAWSYLAAYTSMTGLKDLPGDNLAKSKQILGDANRTADIAAGRAPAG